MAAAAGGGGAYAALSWGSMDRARVFGSRIRKSLRATAFLLAPAGGLGQCAPYVVAQACTEGTPADDFSKGDVFVVANIPHVVAANGDPAVDNPLAQANAVPGDLEGTVEAAYILDRVPMDVLEVLSCLPVEDRAGAFVVQAKLIHRLPARVSLAGLSPAATTDVEAPIGTVCVFTWDEDTNVALLPTDQMITSIAGGIKPTKDAGKRGQGVEGGAPGEQPRVFNGVMTDLDGMFLLCVDKANFQKEEKRSRPCRRAMSQQRTQALLGDRAYVLDEERVKRELQAAFNDPLGTEVPKWAEGLPDLTLSVCQLPVWKIPKLFTAFLQCDGCSFDPDIISLRHYLPSGVMYDDTDLQPLIVALERCEHMLTYCWDGGFLGTTTTLRLRLGGGDLRRKEPKHLWYAAERAYVLFQKILCAETGTLPGEPFKGRPKGAAVAAWNKCLTENFDLTFLTLIREEWSGIQSQMAAQAAAAKSAVDQLPASAKRTKVDPSLAAMCCNHALHQLKVPNAKGCQDATCNRVHYDLGTMKRGEAKTLIKDCAGTHQMGKLLEAADGQLRD